MAARFVLTNLGERLGNSGPGLFEISASDEASCFKLEDHRQEQRSIIAPRRSSRTASVGQRITFPTQQKVETSQTCVGPTLLVRLEAGKRKDLVVG